MTSAATVVQDGDSSMTAYSVIDEPWITCLMDDGSTVDLSLLGIFHRAPHVREVVGDLPTQAFAVLRLLLAVLHAAVDGPRSRRDWQALWDLNELPIDVVGTYLDKHRDRFWLFHPTHPFLQTAGLHTAKNEFSGLEKLIADVPAGHPYFTTRAGLGLAQVTCAEATRWLAHLQAFDVSGIKSGAVGDPRIKGGKGYPIGTGWAGNLGGLFIDGADLRETLLLNLIPKDESDLAVFGHDDRPIWEAEPVGPAPSVDADVRPYGPLDLYTWPSRRVLLRGDESGVTGVVVANGDRLPPQNQHRREPMSAWRRSVPQEKKLGLPLVYMPQVHDPSRALWRGLNTILPAVAPRANRTEPSDHVTAGVVEWAGVAVEDDRQLVLRAIGMVYGTQSAVVDDIVDDRLIVRSTLVGPDGAAQQRMVVDAVRATDDAVFALRDLTANVVRAAGGTDDKTTSGARARAAEQAYAALDGPFRAWLASLTADSDLESTRAAWFDQARKIVGAVGDEIVTAAGPDSWVGREIRGRRVTTPEADGWFRAALIRALPLPVHPEEASDE